MKTIFVGLSGGVDSAVSAYLLKKEGYRVVGAFIKVWEPDFLPCTSGQDRLDAMRVAAHLEIPFVSYDLEEEYKKGVVDYFIEEYKNGRTPNPDVMCNREIKFGAFWEKAHKDGADMIATGHYARREKMGSGYALMRGADDSKDQSYFLWTLAQEDLTHSLFPIGNMQKNDVRHLAEAIRLPNAHKKDSQGLCFLGHVDMKEFLMHYIPAKKGSIKDEGGVVVGEHEGVWFYTLGEKFPIPGGKKMYVVEKRIEQNELILSSTPHALQHATVYELKRHNWIRQNPKAGKTYSAQVRYHGERLICRMEDNLLRFESPVLVAAGQSIVLYDPETNECLGGGIA